MRNTISSFTIAMKNKTGSGRMMVFLTVSGLISNVLTIVSGLLVARWLLPEDLGLFNSFSIITSYIILAQLGIPSGLSRQYPYYLGKDDKAGASQLAATANYWSLALSLVIFLLSLVGTFYYLAIRNWEYAVGVFVIGISTFDGCYTTKYLKVLYRTNNDFNKISIINIIVAVVSFVTIFFVSSFGFYGLCIRAVIIIGTSFFFTWIWRPLAAKPAWTKSLFNELFKVGMPMYFVANIYSLWPIVQRTVVVSLGGNRALGLYGLGLMVGNSMSILTSSISGVAFPKMSMAWGRSHNFKQLIQVMYKPVLGGFVFNSLLVVGGWVILPYFVKFFLPNYVEGIKAAQWSLLVGLIAIFSVYANVYMVIQRNTDRLKSYVTGFVIWAIVLFAFCHFRGFDLVIFPQAMLFGYVGIYTVDFFFYTRYKKMYS